MDTPNITQDKEKLILDAAQLRFGRFGFSKVTMDEIAQDIGLAKASLYYYYPTKENIFRAVITREQERFLRQTETILKDKSPAGVKLTQYIEQRLVLSDQLLTLNALSPVLWTESKPAFRDLFASFSRQELNVLTTIILQGIERGDFETAQPEKTAELILHTLQGLRLRYLQFVQTHGEAPVQRKEFEDQIALLIETLLKGIEKRNNL
jgi:TetR/AcrR family transcriptional regulator